MHLIAEAGRTFTKTELLGEIAAKFGANARFHTCSAENMSAAELIDFLIARGKFHSADENSLALDASAICQH